MAIKSYFDEESKQEFFRIRVVRKSSTMPGVAVTKKAQKISSLTEAKRLERILLQQCERDLLDAERKCIAWDTLVDQWELAVRAHDIFTRDVTPRTVEEYLTVIRCHTSEWNGQPANEIDRAQAWLVMDRVEREISVSRRKRLRSAIDSVFSWAILSGRLKGIKDVPTEGYKSNRKQEEKLPEILNLSEIRKLLAYAKEIGHPWYPVWAMALFTGMRSGELYALEWPSVDFDNNMIYVHRNWTSKTGVGPTKGRCWRAVPLGPQLAQFLRELKLSRGNEKSVLPRFQAWTDGRQADILREFCSGSGIPSVRFHTLRACFATQLIKDGIAPAVVMKIAGWKDLKTMQRYIRLAGVEVKGATDGLKLLPEAEVMATVVNMFQNE